MTSIGGFLRVYGAALALFLVVDLVWLGLVAQPFYQRHLGHLLRPDVRWGPALLFYLIYVAALVVLAVAPGLERHSLAHAVGRGALLGLAAYAAFDLTSLALVRDFPRVLAAVDLVWGTTLSGIVAAVGYLAGSALRPG